MVLTAILSLLGSLASLWLSLLLVGSELGAGSGDLDSDSKNTRQAFILPPHDDHLPAQLFSQAVLYNAPHLCQLLHSPG